MFVFFFINFTFDININFNTVCSFLLTFLPLVIFKSTVYFLQDPLFDMVASRGTENIVATNNISTEAKHVHHFHLGQMTPEEKQKNQTHFNLSKLGVVHDEDNNIMSTISSLGLSPRETDALLGVVRKQEVGANVVVAEVVGVSSPFLSRDTPKKRGDSIIARVKSIRDQ